MTALALCLLALTDAGLSGFRAAAGRNAAVDKRAYYRTAVLRGMATGGVALGVIGIVIGAVVLLASDPVDRYRMFVAHGQTMLAVYVPFATFVAAAFALYTIRSVDLRSMLSTIVFGPITLLRPLVIVGGAFATGVTAGADVLLAALTAAACMLAVEPIVGRYYVD